MLRPFVVGPRWSASSDCVAVGGGWRLVAAASLSAAGRSVCATGPEEEAMALRWYSNVIESTDHRRLAAWWRDALDWQIIFETDDEAVVIPKWAEEIAPKLTFHQFPPGLVFVPVEHEKQTKNRLHMDLAPHLDDDRDAEIARLVAMGAKRIDVGQPADATWTVLADIDGNEFCVLSSRDS